MCTFSETFFSVVLVVRGVDFKLNLTVTLDKKKTKEDATKMCYFLVISDKNFNRRLVNVPS